jgi:hypothetical protein
MKENFTIRVIAILWVVFQSMINVYGQVPQKFSYQAVIRNASNALVINQAVGMRIFILQNSATGSAVYSETHTPTTNSNGLVSIEVGNGIVVSGSFSNINWSSSPYFIQTEVDPAGGTNYSIIATSQLLSVPYALSALNSENSWNMKGNGGTDSAMNFLGTSDVKPLSFRTNNLQRMLISSGGNVLIPSTGILGIGTFTPNANFKLDIVHGGSSGMRIGSTAGSSILNIDAQDGDAQLRFGKAAANQWTLRNRPADNYFEFFESGGGGSRMVIQDATGNVGIGETTAPSYKLDVLHGGSTGIRSRSSSSFSVIDIDAQSGDAALRFAKDGTNQWNTRNNPGTDDYQIFELGGGGERLRIENGTGRVVVNNNLHVTGTLSKAAGSFRIDHPMDPENKYLVHSFVESPDMMNIYNGNITTDASGKATVSLPDYCEVLNRDFRYQLTVIGSFAQAIISKEVGNNSFEIATSVPNIKVSWQVTGIRQDPYANKFRIPNVEEKAIKDKGKYLNPEAYNLPMTRAIGYTPEPIDKDGKVSSSISEEEGKKSAASDEKSIPQTEEKEIKNPLGEKNSPLK